jgi:hypothetical protein
MGKFDNVPVEEDTRLLFSGETTFEEFDIRYEIWDWGGIKAESIIFVSEDVEGLSENEIQEIVKRTSKYKDGEITMSQKNGFVICNFNFTRD